ncbi:MAG TPA: ATP-binding cassette domain-containing protein [Acidimicrobiales bacterium]|jgi:ABC-type branched-subunit amino acid transport system ATPase component/branched-subunit amino acid ABC-type transport system permease component|nr:ATP-binding cassette domain-containing protein [Acidimicrobiales bacterium]
MTQFLALFITGIVSGGIYAILSSGLVLTYVTSGVFNFAYGATAFTVAYVFYQLHSSLNWPLALAAGVSLLIFAPLLGLVLDRTIYQNLAKASGVAKIVTTIGVLVALPNIFLLLANWLSTTFGAPFDTQQTVVLPPGLGPYPPKVWTIASGATINSDQVAVFVAAIVISVGLWIVIRWTRLGLNIRSAVDRRGLASLRGINPIRVSTQTTVVGSMIAGLAGVLVAPLFTLDPNAFTILMFVAAAGAVFGRLRSIPIAMVGGLFVGLAQSMVAGYVNISPSLVPGLRSAVPFVLLFVGVLFMGRERGRQAGQVSEDAPPPDYLSDLSPWRRRLPWIIGVAAVIIWLQMTSTFYASLTSEGIAMGIIFLSFVVITGAGGMVSLAQAAFASLGALVAAALLAQGVPFLPAALIGGLSACVLGLVVALPSLRLGGLWLALATLAAGFMADEVLFQIPAIGGPASGRSIARPVLGPFNFNDQKTYGMLLLLIFGIVALLVFNLLRSPTGRLMSAVRSSEVATETSGASTIMPKFVLFGVSAAIAGFGGTLLSANNFRADPLNFPTTVGVVWIAVMAVFGVRRIGSAFIAGLVYILFPELLQHVTTSTLLPTVLFGLGAISLAKNPDGIMAIRGLKDQAGRERRRRKRAAAEAATALATSSPVAGADDEPGSEVVPSSAVVPEGGVPAVAVYASVNPISDGPLTVPALEFRGISAGYDGVMAVHGADIIVPQGQFLVIVGPNGAGKSTLCSVAAGLHLPISGTVLFDGVDITPLPAHERAQRGLILAPEYRGIFPGLSVEDNLAVWVKDPKARESALSRFPVLAERRRQAAQLLSGGEQQMLTLAPLLERVPRVLIVDEPSLGLSPMATSQVLTALGELRAQGTTVIVAEEQARRVLEVADHVVVLEVGRVTWDGPAAAFSEDQARELYLGKAGS